jgi:hypothetical protein
MEPPSSKRLHTTNHEVSSVHRTINWLSSDGTGVSQVDNWLSSDGTGVSQVKNNTEQPAESPIQGCPHRWLGVFEEAEQQATTPNMSL